jgi:hypothetical protein
MLRPKNVEIRNVMTKDPTKPKKNAMKWSQIRRRVELYVREMILRSTVFEIVFENIGKAKPKLEKSRFK